MWPLLFTILFCAFILNGAPTKEESNRSSNFIWIVLDPNLDTSRKSVQLDPVLPGCCARHGWHGFASGLALATAASA
ncbi:hypothetical protein V5799_013380 [Amblyomma americanum]|uniref:Secreted protein n=1 Tax=Amblyomma americanum TaxID=6943 RepID=A0AAQ4E662_AMBAM